MWSVKGMLTGKKTVTTSQQPLTNVRISTGRMLLELILNPLVDLISLIYINCMIASTQSKQHSDSYLTKLVKSPFNSMHETTLDLFCGDDNSDEENHMFAEEFAASLEERAAFYEVTVDYYMEEFLT